MKTINVLSTAVLLLLAVEVAATASVHSLNACPDMIFIDGIEDAAVPSGGLGGLYPGAQVRTVTVGAAQHDYYLYVPTSYTPSSPMPMLVAWHGSVINQAAIPLVAQQTRDFWQSEAEAQRFIVVAQAATGGTGCAPCGWRSSDVSVLSALLSDVQADYNIATTRRYAWGYSAGGHIMHYLGLLNSEFFAAYAVSGAELSFAASQAVYPTSATRKIPTYISVGQSDFYYPYAQADIITFLQAGWELNHNLWFDDFIGGHEINHQLPTQAWNKICISTTLD